MQTKQKIVSLAAMLAAFLIAAPAAGFDFNKSIRIEPGSRSDGGSTVSGSITVGAGAVVEGGLETVNGSITVEDDARIRGAQTVNGSVTMASNVAAQEVSTVNGNIRIGESGEIGGSVSTVNGRIEIGAGTTVTGDTGNINGAIRITASEIGGDLTTVNGGVTLERDVLLRGDLIVEETTGRNWPNSKPKVVIGPGSRVEGRLRLEREVELYISDRAEVGGVTGRMSMDDAVRFSGDRP